MKLALTLLITGVLILGSALFYSTRKIAKLDGQVKQMIAINDTTKSQAFKAGFYTANLFYLTEANKRVGAANYWLKYASQVASAVKSIEPSHRLSAQVMIINFQTKALDYLLQEWPKWEPTDPEIIRGLDTLKLGKWILTDTPTFIGANAQAKSRNWIVVGANDSLK